MGHPSPLPMAEERCYAELVTEEPSEHIRCLMPKGHREEHTGKGHDGSSWYWFDPVLPPLDIDLSQQEWYLLHSVLDGAMMSAGVMPTPDDVTAYDICVEHVNEVKAEKDIVTRIHSKVARIIQAIDNQQKITITVIPF